MGEQEKSLHVPYRRREASISTTRQLCDDKRTYSLRSAGTYTSLSSEQFIQKNDSSRQKLGERFEAVRLVTRVFGISSVRHSLYVHNNLNARQTDVRHLNGFTDSRVNKHTRYIHQNSNFDVCTVYVVQFIVQTNKCTTYIYIYIYIYMCVCICICVCICCVHIYPIHKILCVCIYIYKHIIF